MISYHYQVMIELITEQEFETDCYFFLLKGLEIALVKLVLAVTTS
jgi:hypothetical protein